MEVSRSFSVDSKLDGHGRDAPGMYISLVYLGAERVLLADFHKSVCPASVQDFTSESSTAVFLVGLKTLPHAWMERGKKPKVTLKLMMSLSPLQVGSSPSFIAGV